MLSTKLKTNNKIDQILKGREERNVLIASHFNNDDNRLVSISLNIPGIKKNRKCFDKFFNTLTILIEMKLLEIGQIYYEEKIKNAAGNFAIIVIDSDLNDVELKTVLVEIELALKDAGPLLDLDLYISSLVTIQRRRDLGLFDRKCLMCDHSAKVCAVKQIHDKKQLHKLAVKLIKKFIKNM